VKNKKYFGICKPMIEHTRAEVQPVMQENLKKIKVPSEKRLKQDCRPQYRGKPVDF